MNPKTSWQRPGIVWLQRSKFHLERHRSEALAANDAAAYWAADASIRMLDVFIGLLQEADRTRRRKKREEVRRLAELNVQNKKLQERLSENGNFVLPIAA
jgi:hypothetical protein